MYEEDLAALREALKEVARESLQDISKWKKELKIELTEWLNELGKVVEHVRVSPDCPPQVVES